MYLPLFFVLVFLENIFYFWENTGGVRRTNLRFWNRRMKIIQDWQNTPPLAEPRIIMTIGTFDGLHLGHHSLIKQVISRAKAKDASSLLLTFEPHPLVVLSPHSAPHVLTTFEQKCKVLEEWGIDILGCVRFTETLSSLGAEVFLTDVINPKVNLKDIFIGSDFRFGRNAEGHVGVLLNWAKKHSVSVQTVAIQKSSTGESLSSSHIRGLLKVGLVDSVSKLLGRNYRIDGTVIEGAKRGGALGFPTANLGEINQLIPGPGVYAVNAFLKGKSYPAMTSIGNNPTFKNQYLSVETFLIDFSSDFYGEKLGLEFVSRIRNMIRFESPASLVEQLKKDELKVRKVLKIK